MTVDISNYQTMDLLESIVRNLAKVDTPYDDEYGYCTICYESKGSHETDCAWLNAVQWVRDHPDA